MHLSIVKIPQSKPIFLAMLLSLTEVIGGLLYQRLVRVPLLQQAHGIADVSTWKSWWWLDAHRVFVVEKTSYNCCAAFVFDTSSGKRMAFSGLSRTLSTLGSDCRLELSPNGKWMVALPWKVAPRTHWLISVASGDISTRYTASFFREWLPDSSGWIGGSVNKKSSGESLFWVHGGPASQRPHPPEISGVNLGFSATGDPWIGEYDPYSRANLKLHEIDRKTGRVRHTESIPLPPSCLLCEVNVSPDRKRLVWQTRPAPLSSLAALLDRQDINTVWISNINGTKMKNMGELPVKYGTDYDCDLSIQWLPDSQHIGVIYRYMIYVLPVGI